VDPSALIFVALAVAWAVYLVPKALEHHDESLRSRTVSTFSHTMRVLARREPDGRSARLVAGAPAAPKPVAAVSAKRASRSRSAAARRRNVLALILLANIGVGVAVGLGRLGWYWPAVPGALLVAWLIACRLMVRRERAVSARAVARPRTESQYAGPTAADGSEVDVEVAPQLGQVELLDDGTADIPVVVEGSWEPVEVPLPTYVSKPPAARRTVRTIDLDATGVWSSGRSESDSALAREADAARRSARDEQAQRRATGS